MRELRNQASRVVRRARSGERIVITLDGVPVAQIVPLDPTPNEPSIEELVASGRLIAPLTNAPPDDPAPILLEGVGPLSDIVVGQRDW